MKSGKEKDKEKYIEMVHAELKRIDHTFRISNWYDIIHLFNEGIPFKQAAKKIYKIYR